jgi:hypothetical protein
LGLVLVIDGVSYILGAFINYMFANAHLVAGLLTVSHHR